MQDETGEGTPRQPVKPWVWAVVAAVILVLLGGWWYTTQTEQGRLWMLGLAGRTVVPNVVGLSQTGAQAALNSAGLRTGPVSEEPTLAVPPGTVVTQDPAAGATVSKDAAIALGVSAVPTVKVPDVVGHTQSDATTLLAEQGLRTGTITYVYSSSVAAGNVTQQAPPAATETTVGSVVGLTVSKGKQQGQVPNVVGLPQDDASSALEAAGFKVTTVKATSTSVPAGNVISQSPAAGTVTPTGGSVTITVSTGAPAQAPPAQSSTPTPTPPPAEQPKPEPPKAEVPDVIGMGVLQAVTALQKAQLKVAFAWEKSKGNFLKVIKQDPSAGASATPGDTVTITIGLPSFSFEPPTVNPLPTPEATSKPAPTQPSATTPGQPAQPSATTPVVPAPQPAPQPAPAPTTPTSATP